MNKDNIRNEMLSFDEQERTKLIDQYIYEIQNGTTDDKPRAISKLA